MGSRDHSVECEACGELRGGMNDLQCDCDNPMDWVRVEAMAARAYTSAALDNLGRQLTIAAGLTRAWNNGVDECAGWSPGCREEMP